MIEYEYGQHCGDENCHACGTQRYNCDELNKLDNISDMETENQVINVLLLLTTIKLQCL